MCVQSYAFISSLEQPHFLSFKQKAVEVMCFVPKRCNDMMNVGRLQGFEVHLRNLDHPSQSSKHLSCQLFSPWKPHRNHFLCLLCLYSLWYQGKITAQGKLLQQDTFTVTEQDSSFLSRAKERRVFLFEQLVIFSEPIDRKKGFSLPGYIFKNSIKVGDCWARVKISHGWCFSDIKKWESTFESQVTSYTTDPH